MSDSAAFAALMLETILEVLERTQTDHAGDYVSDPVKRLLCFIGKGLISVSEDDVRAFAFTPAHLQEERSASNATGKAAFMVPENVPLEGGTGSAGRGDHRKHRGGTAEFRRDCSGT